MQSGLAVHASRHSSKFILTKTEFACMELPRLQTGPAHWMYSHGGFWTMQSVACGRARGRAGRRGRSIALAGRRRTQEGCACAGAGGGGGCLLSAWTATGAQSHASATATRRPSRRRPPRMARRAFHARRLGAPRGMGLVGRVVSAWAAARGCAGRGHRACRTSPRRDRSAVRRVRNPARAWRRVLLVGRWWGTGARPVAGRGVHHPT